MPAKNTLDVPNAVSSEFEVGQASTDVKTNSPAAVWVNQILRIAGTDVREWTNRLDSRIPLKSWETL
jgi:hypothetical protein